MEQRLLVVALLAAVMSVSLNHGQEFDMSVFSEGFTESSNFVCGNRAQCCAKARACLRQIAFESVQKGIEGGCGFPVCPRNFNLDATGSCSLWMEYSPNGFISKPAFDNFTDCREESTMQFSWQHCHWPFMEALERCLEQTYVCTTTMFSGAECTTYYNLTGWDDYPTIEAGYL